MEVISYTHTHTTTTTTTRLSFHRSQKWIGRGTRRIYQYPLRESNQAVQPAEHHFTDEYIIKEFPPLTYDNGRIFLASLKTKLQHKNGHYAVLYSHYIRLQKALCPNATKPTTVASRFKMCTIGTIEHWNRRLESRFGHEYSPLSLLCWPV
jgi:hypothetical protein